MDEFINILAAIMEPLGGQARNFIVNYRDSDHNYFNMPVSLFQPPGVELCRDEITAGLINPIEAEGYTAFFAAELLNGYTDERLEALSKRDPVEAYKNISIVYYDAKKE